MLPNSYIDFFRSFRGRFQSAVLAGFGEIAPTGFVVDFRVDVLVAAYAPLLHLLIGADIILGKLFLPEDDVEAQSEDAQGDKRQGCKEQFHRVILENEVAADRLVVIDFVDDLGEDLGHRNDADFRVVRKLRMRDGVGDEDLLEL